MKKLILLLLVVPIVSFGQGMFKEVEKKDEFGDVVGTELVNISEGTFSNNAEKDEYFKVKVILSDYPYPQYSKSSRPNLNSFEEYLKDMKNIYPFKINPDDSKSMVKNKTRDYNYWVKKEAKYTYEKALSFVGRIDFIFFKYENLQRYTPSRNNTVKIKFSDGTKSISFLENRGIFLGYTDVSFNKQVKKTFTSTIDSKTDDYRNTYINDERVFDGFLVSKIINSNDPIQFVFEDLETVFKFTMNPQ